MKRHDRVAAILTVSGLLAGTLLAFIAPISLSRAAERLPMFEYRRVSCYGGGEGCDDFEETRVLMRIDFGEDLGTWYMVRNMSTDGGTTYKIGYQYIFHAYNESWTTYDHCRQYIDISSFWWGNSTKGYSKDWDSARSITHTDVVEYYDGIYPSAGYNQ
ncbi:MAG: hypothetical protein ACTSU5_12420, partial [Promethearchaeota archaeon]